MLVNTGLATIDSTAAGKGLGTSPGRCPACRRRSAPRAARPRESIVARCPVDARLARRRSARPRGRALARRPVDAQLARRRSAPRATRPRARAVARCPVDARLARRRSAPRAARPRGSIVARCPVDARLAPRRSARTRRRRSSPIGDTRGSGIAETGDGRPSPKIASPAERLQGLPCPILPRPQDFRIALHLVPQKRRYFGQTRSLLPLTAHAHSQRSVV
jgi:hypothetical protein